MAEYQWTGDSGTGDVGSAGNWQDVTTAQNPALTPPGPNDDATIDTAGATITGAGIALRFIFEGNEHVAARLTTTYGSQMNGNTLFRPGAALTTPLLGVAFANNDTGTLTVGARSKVVIGGTAPVVATALAVGDNLGTTGVMVVEGEEAAFFGGNQPLAVGGSGAGLLRIARGGVVTGGAAQAPNGITFAVTIAHEPGSDGILTLNGGALLAHGPLYVGQRSGGTLDIAEDSLVTAAGLMIGASATGQGAVLVHGRNARLVVAGTLSVGGPGTGRLEVADEALVSATDSIVVAGSALLDGGLIDTTDITLDANATLSGRGVVSAGANIANAGTIAAGEHLTLIGMLQNAGTVVVEQGGHLTMAGAVSGSGSITIRHRGTAVLRDLSGQVLTFDGSGANLVLERPDAFAGTIQGFGPGDTISLEVRATGLSFAGGILTIAGGAAVLAQLTFLGSYTVNNFRLSAAPDGGSVIRYHV